MTSKPFHVVILGGGYAGTMAANRILTGLTPQSAVSVTVVNPSPDFVPRIRLHQVAASGGDPTVPLSSVLHPDAQLVVQTVLRIAADAVIGDGWELPYDALVYAVGSRTRTDFPGAEHIHHVGDLASARSTHERFLRLHTGAKVVVVGGGLTGVETASELAEKRPDVTVELVTSRSVGHGLSPTAQRILTRALDKLGVVVHSGVRVERVEAGQIVDTVGHSRPFDMCIWAASMTVPTLAADSGLPVDEDGRLMVDETLRCPVNQRIVGAGDAVSPPRAVAGHLRMSCAAALPLGVHAGQTVNRIISGTQPEPLSVGFMVQCISLGRKHGLVQPVAVDDTAKGPAIGGGIAAFIKEQISNYTLNVLRQERQKPTYRYPAGPKGGTLISMPKGDTVR